MQLMRPGRNCWRVEHADRAAMLVDGEAYFAALHSAITQARHTIRILAWDIDSRLRLVRGTSRRDSAKGLLEAIKTALNRNPGLHAYILAWDFSMIYALEREWLPLFNGNWRDHGRLHFRMDGYHPLAASQHQKVVVIDDSLAFVGGIDPSKWRWDTTEHRPEHPLRRDPGGTPYPPFHDIMLAVDGDAARALGELARERWQATGCPAGALTEARREVWPEGLSPDFEDLTVAIARTLPAYGEQDEVREVERSLLDCVASARHHLYIENQYFTSSVIGEALAKRLAEEAGPEVVLVLPREKDGWLERVTMDVLRARLVRRLRSADHYGRLRVYYPHVPGLDDQCVSLHTKLVIVDDHLLHTGSANLSNRSMGLDSECNLVIEARDEAGRRGIATCRARLLAEHLDCEPQEVLDAETGQTSLIAVIERLQGRERSLRELDTSVPPELEREVPDAAILDPERPVDPELFIDEFIGREARRPAWRQLLGMVTLLMFLLALVAAWRWTPLGEWLTPDKLGHLAERLAETPWGHAMLVGGMVLASLLAVPLALLITATSAAFGSGLGFLYAFSACLLSASAGYGLGRFLGRDKLRRVAGGKLNRLSRRLARRGVITVATVRMVPVAPFVVVNLVAGASHIHFRDYLLGTAFGMAPGVLALSLFADGLTAALRDPSQETLTALALVVTAIAAAALWLGRWTRSSRERGH